MPSTGDPPGQDNTVSLGAVRFTCLPPLMIAIYLLGLSCLQLWFYIEKYIHTDRLWLKIYTISLWILSTVYLILVLKFAYIYFVREFGNVAFLDHLPKDIHGTAPFSPVICAMVQTLFVMRAWNLSGNYFLTGFLAFAVIAQLATTVLFIHKLRDFSRLSQVLNIIAYERAMNIIAVCTDMVIALSLIWLLSRYRSGFRRTDGIIRKLVAFTIGTGLITGVMAMVAFVTAQLLPQTIFAVYYNCMLASLNARSALRNEFNATGGISIHLDDLACTSEEQAPAITGAAILASNSCMDYTPKAIECRVDIDIESGSREAGMPLLFL
ncbi:hypothetical protein ACEPAG_8297 [Sanghuangporus baumii]